VQQPDRGAERGSGAGHEQAGLDELEVPEPTRTEVIGAIPQAMPCGEVLDLAGLVHSAQEHQELRHRIAPAQPAGPGLQASA
jgi:hypothetical protein